jgi:hypothetical protein
VAFVFAFYKISFESRAELTALPSPDFFVVFKYIYFFLIKHPAAQSPISGRIYATSKV